MSEGDHPVEPKGENSTSSTPKKRQHVQDDDRDNPPPLTINSLKDLNVQFAPDIIQHLSLPHKADQEYIKRLRKAMKRPVSTTTCRVNLINATRKQVLKELKVILFSMPNLDIRENTLFLDVIDIKDNSSEDRSADLSACTIPKIDSSSTSSSLFANWPTRQEKGWPMSHRALLCDRLCGEAVLRGSDIFVRGILAADPGIQAGEKVAVYADIPLKSNGIHRKNIARGILLENYHGNCVFLGLGTMKCSRREIFSQSSGIAVSMSLEASERVGPLLPPLCGVLTDKMMLQNLPSILVAHALNPQPGDFILDMCAAPGGKTAHLASLVNNQATIVACDRSRKKMLAAKELFERLGAYCITPLALDSTRCVNSYEDKSVAEVRYFKVLCGNASYTETMACSNLILFPFQLLKDAKTDPKDGLKSIKHFSPESFDKILLDPPCSALGLRPKLLVVHQNVHQLEKHASYQRKFINQAVMLLRPGGCMTYSTCTMNSTENESMVNFILQEYPWMELIPLGVEESMGGCFGRPGLQGFGLNEVHRLLVRRFDPGDIEQDTMGFFVARFRKRSTVTGYEGST
jgi:methyltransferase NSUN6